MGTNGSRLAIGMDVGSTTVKAAVVDPESKKILWSDYQRHHTKQPEYVLSMLEAILAAFPGARVGPVRDSTLDAYGLPPEPGPDEPLLADGEPPDMEFAPLDSEPVGLEDLDDSRDTETAR